MENKDEQIRKELIYFIRKEKEYIESKVKPENSPKLMFLIDALAYLEKQKEQKPLMYDGEIEDRKRDIVAALRKYYPIDYAEYLTSFLRGLSPEDNSADEYGQKMLGIAYKLMYEHIPESLRTKEFWHSLKFMREYTGRVAIIHSYEKPAEWSEEDEINKDLAIGKFEGTEVELDYDVTQQVISWLKWLPNRYVPGGKCTICKEHSLGYQEGLKAGREELKQEWNKEDERNLYNIIEAIKYSYDVSEGSGGLRLINWLKYHLRPQPHWKPSEYTLSLVKKVANGEMLTHMEQMAMETLCNDLQKLL